MKDVPTHRQADSDNKDRTMARYLGPGDCRVHLGEHEALSATICGEGTYGGVYAAYVFPVAYPTNYISLIQSREDGPGIELGIIKDLDKFPPDQAKLIREALDRRYFVHKVSRIHDIGWKHGFVAMSVDTDKGRIDFLMRWQQDKALDYGSSGKVLIDVNDNRYLIPSVSDLTAAERNRFTRIIYW